MSETKYLDAKASQEKNEFFSKNHFFAIFLQFFDTSKSGDMTDPECVHTYDWIGQISKFWILRCRNFVKILRKNDFWKKTHFFLGKLWRLNTSVSDVFLGPGGAAE